MFKRFSIFILIVLSVMLASCVDLGSAGFNGIKGSGQYVTRDYGVEGFTGINVCCGFKVTVTGGDTFKVSVTADDNVMDYIVAKKEGTNLRLGFDTSKISSFNTTKLEATVTMPALQAVTLSGGSQLYLGQSAPQGSSLNVDASGGSQAHLEGMPAQRASVHLSGGAAATVNVTSNLDYDLSGGSSLKYTGNPTIGISSTSGGAQATKF